MDSVLLSLSLTFLSLSVSVFGPLVLKFSLCVPLTWTKLHFSLKHSFFESHLEHIIGWKCSHLDPFLQDFGPFVPWVSNFLQTGGWWKGHVVPFLQCLVFFHVESTVSVTFISKSSLLFSRCLLILNVVPLVPFL